MINCLRREPGGEAVRGILVQDPTAPSFSLKNSLYSKQLEKDLVVSVLRENRVWGTYCHSLLPRFQSTLVHNYSLKQTTPGDLSTFKWTEGPCQPADNSKHEVKIAYSSINARYDSMMTKNDESLS